MGGIYYNGELYAGSPPNKDIYFGTCDLQTANQIKVVTISADQNFVLEKGIAIHVKFDADNTYSATAGNPIKLNVNNTGAKEVYYGNGFPTGTNTTAFGRINYVNQYIYDGTYWVWQGSSIDNNTAQVNSDWNASSGAAEILNKPTLGTAAAKDFDTTPTSGSSNLITSGGVYSYIDTTITQALTGSY